MRCDVPGIITVLNFVINRLCCDRTELVDNFLLGRDIESAVNDLAPHIHPDVAEAWEGAPTTHIIRLGAILDGAIIEVLEVFGPDKFWSIPYCASILAGLLHHGSDACSDRIFLSVVISEQSSERTVPSAVVVTHAVVLGKSCYKRSESDALIIVET